MKVLLGCLLLASAVMAQNQPLNLLIITGGHDFEREAFFDMFADMPNIKFSSVQHPQANLIYATPALQNYDVLLYYDMNQDISEDQKQAFLNMMQQGKGIVFLHHSLASYQNWDEFLQIQGGRYLLNPADERQKSTYQHDEEVDVHVVDPTHPVTRGLSDFTIHDEVYGNFQVLPDVTPLLTTEHPLSSNTIAWAHTYGPSKIVTIQLGHDHVAYENGNFQTLLRQAILWVAVSTLHESRSR